MITKIHNLKYFLNNKIVGNCGFMFMNNNKCYINNINILENYRNQKYGSKMLKDVEQICKNMNVNKVQLTVFEEPVSNLCDFYIKNGYKHVNNNPVFHKTSDDTYYYLYNMYKNI